MTSSIGIMASSGKHAAPPEPTAWLRRETGSTIGSDRLRSTVAGAGSSVVGVGYNNTATHPLTEVSSNGGVTFTRYNHFATLGARQLTSSCYADGNYIFGALGPASAGKSIYTSPDGITLTERGPSEQNTIYALAHNGQSGGSSLVMAVGWQSPSSSTPYVATSADGGATWTEKAATGVNDGMTGVCHNGLAGASGRWVAVSAEAIWVSADDGATWTQASTGTAVGFEGVSFGNSKFVVIVDDNGTTNFSEVKTAPADASAWTSHALPFKLFSYPVGVAFGGSLHVVIAGAPDDVMDAGYSFATSSDGGSTWTGKNDAVYDTFRLRAFGLSYGASKFFTQSPSNADASDMIASYQ